MNEGKKRNKYYKKLLHWFTEQKKEVHIKFKKKKKKVRFLT